MSLPFFNSLKRQFEKNIDARGLALFRIVFSLILFMEIRNQNFFQKLIFDSPENHSLSGVDFSLGIDLWSFIVLFLALGLFTRLFSVLNFVLSLVFISTTGKYGHLFQHEYLGISFLLMFLPVSRTWSLDRLVEKLRFSTARFQYVPPTTVNKLSYTIPVFFVMVLLLFNSVFHASWSANHLSGFGLSAANEINIDGSNGFSGLTGQGFFGKVMGYLTLSFELFLIFLLWFRWSRWPFFIIGTGLHLAMLVFSPNPWIAPGVISVYFLLVPAATFRWLDSVKKPDPGLRFFFDQECPLCVRTKIVISHFDVFGQIQFLPIQVWHEKEAAFDLVPFEEALNSIYSLDNKGKLREGFDTYIQVFRRVPILMPVYLFCLLPGIGFIGRKIYGFVAANREVQRCTDDNCGYNPPSFPQNGNEIKVLRNLRLGDLKFAIIYSFLAVWLVIQLCLAFATEL